MDGAVIGAESSVAALAFVKAGFAVPPRTLVGGIPARIMRVLSDDEIAWKSEGTAGYQQLTRRCLRSLRRSSRRGARARPAAPRCQRLQAPR